MTPADIASQLRHQFANGSVWAGPDLVHPHDGAQRALAATQGPERHAWATAIARLLLSDDLRERTGATALLRDVIAELDLDLLAVQVRAADARFRAVRPAWRLEHDDLEHVVALAIAKGLRTSDTSALAWLFELARARSWGFYLLTDLARVDPDTLIVNARGLVPHDHLGVLGALRPEHQERLIDALSPYPAEKPTFFTKAFWNRLPPADADRLRARMWPPTPDAAHLEAAFPLVGFLETALAPIRLDSLFPSELATELAGERDRYAAVGLVQMLNSARTSGRPLRIVPLDQAPDLARQALARRVLPGRGGYAATLYDNDGAALFNAGAWFHLDGAWRYVDPIPALPFPASGPPAAAQPPTPEGLQETILALCDAAARGDVDALMAGVAAVRPKDAQADRLHFDRALLRAVIDSPNARAVPNDVRTAVARDPDADTLGNAELRHHALPTWIHVDGRWCWLADRFAVVATPATTDGLMTAARCWKNGRRLPYLAARDADSLAIPDAPRWFAARFGAELAEVALADYRASLARGTLGAVLDHASDHAAQSCFGRLDAAGPAGSLIERMVDPVPLFWVVFTSGTDLGPFVHVDGRWRWLGKLATTTAQPLRPRASLPTDSPGRLVEDLTSFCRQVLGVNPGRGAMMAGGRVPLPPDLVEHATRFVLPDPARFFTFAPSFAASYVSSPLAVFGFAYDVASHGFVPVAATLATQDGGLGAELLASLGAPAIYEVQWKSAERELPLGLFAHADGAWRLVDLSGAFTLPDWTRILDYRRRFPSGAAGLDALVAALLTSSSRPLALLVHRALLNDLVTDAAVRGRLADSFLGFKDERPRASYQAKVEDASSDEGEVVCRLSGSHTTLHIGPFRYGDDGWRLLPPYLRRARIT